MQSDTNTASPSGAAALTTILKNEGSLARLREGDVREVELMKKAQRAVYFDLGRFGTGIIYGAELGNAREVIKGLNPGDKVAAKIVMIDAESGYTELSLAEAGKQRQWQTVQDLADSGEIIKFKITGANAGGLMGAISDLKAFLPLSQLSNEHYSKLAEGEREKNIEELKKFVGQELSVKVINVNPRNNKLIVSERETLGANMKELLAKYEVGQTIDGMVSGLADFGIFMRFVDNPQIEGLVHISEIDHRVIDNPKEVMKLNETAKVKIIDIREGRVFLSLKALKADPWTTLADAHKAGEEVKGKVYKFNPFGAIIDLASGLQGMVHVSEFGGSEEMHKALVIGESYQFVVDSVKPEEKRIILKLKK
jgi:small subunit ribosomal protein S1